MKRSGVLVVLLRVLNQGLWTHFESSRRNATICTRQGMMWGATEDLKNAAISFIFFSLGTLGSDYMYFKFSDEHPRLFHKGVIPGVYTRRQYNTD